MLNELKIIRNALARLTVEFFGLVGLFMFAPLVKGATVAEWAIGLMQTQFLPTGSALAVHSPLDGFFAQAAVAAALACIVLLPLLFFELWRFLAPGLHAREATALAGGLVAALALAALGAAFAWLVLVPVMFTELFAFVPAGVVPLFSLQKVVSLVAGFTLGTALIFLLPLVMALLTLVGLVPARLWRAYARPAVLLVLIASAIITPDGSGVGMVLLALPVVGLYGAGYAGAKLLA